ncbi:protein phosphatase 2C domain-containing protein [Arthrobacter castelli]|uniref:protein phosphatase 2C domain-containing protein n=1 Tax=Arthrobacter castelli TaxID=271431 RepID=UPI0003FEDDC1|nr:protein phosphatase 2C domain-containing protein [Arthrobacter castelli]
MAKILRFAARSDVGRVRSKNDDSAYAGHHLAVVADGMGGHAGGNIASASTVLEMIHLDEDGYQGDEAGTALADEIQTANSLLADLVRSSPALAGMGTTVTAMLLSGDKLHFAHIGDSRAYRLKDGVFEQISVDHTFVQRLIDEGRLRPKDAESHPHKNVLMRVLGDVDASPELDLATFDADIGERWLLCSDGLNAVVDERTIEQFVRAYSDPQECADRLVEVTLDGGSPDNVTVVLADIVHKTPDDVATRSLTVIDSGSTTSPTAADTSAARPDGGTDAAGDAESEEPDNPDHLNAEVLRRELANRQHVLVGSAASAAATGQIPKVAERSATRSAQRRAAMLLTHKSPETAEEVEGAELERRPRGRKLLAVALAAAVVVIVAAGLWAGYAWTQTRYYVGQFEGHVAVYRGISQDLGPISLSTLRSKTVIEVESLPQYAQQRLERTLPAEDINEAFRIVRDLQFPRPDSSTSGPGATPSESASPTGGPTEEPTDNASTEPTGDPTSGASPTGSGPEPTATNEAGGGS